MVRIGGFARLQEIVEGFRVRYGRQLAALLRGQGHNAVPAFGRFHHAPDGRDFRVAERTRHHSVGGDHEIFDQFACAVLLAGANALNFSIDNEDLGLDAVKVERAHFAPRLPQGLRRFIL